MAKRYDRIRRPGAGSNLPKPAKLEDLLNDPNIETRSLNMPTPIELSDLESNQESGIGHQSTDKPSDTTDQSKPPSNKPPTSSSEDDD